MEFEGAPQLPVACQVRILDETKPELFILLGPLPALGLESRGNGRKTEGKWKGPGRFSPPARQVPMLGLAAHPAQTWKTRVRFNC